MQAEGLDLRRAMAIPFTGTDFLKAYRLFQRIMGHPDMIFLAREILLDALETEGIITGDAIEQAAVLELGTLGNHEPDEGTIQEYSDLLTDVWAAASFSENQIDSYINFAVKQKQFSKLVMFVNREGISYGKIKRELKAFCRIPEGDRIIPPNEAEGARVGLVNMFISNQLPFIGIAKQHITVRDVGELSDRIIRSKRRPGRIGGKSAGMVLAHRILVPRFGANDPQLAKYIKIPESWYINTGVFADFIDQNDLHQFHAQKYKSREAIEADYEHIADLYKNTAFPSDVMERFRELLIRIGEHPLVLRSSSLLEDNFGYAFSGKYDSIFLGNQGDIDTRLEKFVWGLKQVHMSTFGPAPILYRRNNNLLDFNEQMSVLVQKVVGRRFGNYFYPFAAGVGFSFSAYSWTPRINKADGVMRLVMGLGTRAVDRIGEDYPRMVHLSDPMLRPEVTADKIKKYSQKLMDVLNLETGVVEHVHFMDVMAEASHPDLFFALSENRDGHLAPPMFKNKKMELGTACITFDHLLQKTALPQLMKTALKTLEEAYGRPVDVEFAWDGEKLYIVQCRTLSVAKDEEIVMPEDIPKENLFFRNNRVISGGAVKKLNYIVYVDPKAYADLTTVDEKLEVSRVVSLINRKMKKERYALFGPGRWGSSDINLGVKAGYEDINHALVLGEVAFEAEGSTPEVSYGTHFFNDLVESGIVHVALFPDEPDAYFNEAFLLDSPNQLAALLPDYASFESVIRLIHLPACLEGRLLSVFQDSRNQKGAGFFETRKPGEDA